mgnify:CR=1 FL=1
MICTQLWLSIGPVSSECITIYTSTGVLASVYFFYFFCTLDYFQNNATSPSIVEKLNYNLSINLAIKTLIQGVGLGHCQIS